MNALLKMFDKTRFTEPEKAEQIAKEAVDLGTKNPELKGYPTALYNQAIFIGEQGEFDKSDSLLRAGIKLYHAAGNLRGEANCLMAMGNNKYDKSEFNTALDLYLETARLREKAQDKKGLSASYIWIGNVYNNGLSQHKQSLVYYQKALDIQLETKDGSYLAFTYNNLGNVYYHLKDYPQALDFLTRAIERKKQDRNRKGLSSSYNNLANVYYDMKDYQKALEYYDLSLAIRKEFNDPTGIATSYANIGNTYIRLKDAAHAIASHELALKQAREVDYKEGIKEALTGLAAAYELNGDFKRSLEYFKLASDAQDSLLNEEHMQQIAHAQVKFETGRKENENKILQQENEIKSIALSKSRLTQIFLWAGILLVVLVAALLYSRAKLKQRQELDAERIRQQELRSKAVIEAEEKERLRIARELHDGVGQQLSAAKLNISGLQSTLQVKTEEERALIKNAIDLLDESVKEVRTVSHSMMPNALIKSGLVSAVREFIHKISSTGNLKVNLEIVGLTERLDNTLETVLFRVLQEIVSNIIKHAHATEVSIQFVKHESELTLLVEDNGAGFDVTKKLEASGGIGLKNIQSRVEYLNGQVFFDSYPGKGTTVSIEIPLKG